MRGLRAPKSACQSCRGCECGLSRVDPAGQPCSDLLEQPAVAVRVAERGEGSVASVLGCGPFEAAGCTIGLKLSARCYGMEHLADLDLTRDKFGARSIDVGDNQIKVL